MKSLKHKHRIKPGHEGGEYTPDNVIEVSVTQHAMWHFANWQLRGKEEDRLAWRGLSGFYGKEEVIREFCKLQGDLSVELRTGIHRLTPEEKSVCGRKPHVLDPGLAVRAGTLGGLKTGSSSVSQKLGLYDPENKKKVIEGTKKGGKKAVDKKLGIHAPENKGKGAMAAAVKNSKTVVCLSTGKTFSSAVEASRETGANKNSIWACCKGYRKSAGGMRWAYM